MNTLNAIRSVYLIADFIILLLTIKAMNKKTKMGNVVAAVMAAGFAVVTFYTITLFAKSYFYVLLFNSCVFFSIDIMLLLLVRYILLFSKLELKGSNKVSRGVFGFVFLMEAVVLMLNPFVEHAVTLSGYEVDGFMLYTYVAKTYFYFHLGLCYFMVIMCVALLIYKIRITPKMYRGRYSNTLISFLAAVLINFLFLAGMELFRMDFSFLFYALIAMFIYSSTFGFKERFLLTYRSAAFQNVGLPVLLFDYEENLGDFNEEAEKLFPFLTEWKEERESEMDLKTFLTEAGIELRSLYEDESFMYRRGAGEQEVIFNGRYMCHKENDGKFSAGMMVFHDVTTEQKMLEQEQNMSRSKTNFLMNVSAGIKKPLFAILDKLTVLEEKYTDDESKQEITSVYQSATLALNLIEELMEYSMVEAGHLQSKRDVVQMADYVEFLQMVIRDCEHLATIQIEIDDFLPKQVIADFEHLKRLGATLIRNAAEQAENKEVRVLLYYSEEGKNKGTLELEITDNGQDILQQMMFRIKDVLEMPEEAVDCTAISEGLELYMICRLAKNMGGDVEVCVDEEGKNFVHAYVRVELKAGI